MDLFPSGSLYATCFTIPLNQGPLSLLNHKQTCLLHSLDPNQLWSIGFPCPLALLSMSIGYQYLCLFLLVRASTWEWRKRTPHWNFREYLEYSYGSLSMITCKSHVFSLILMPYLTWPNAFYSCRYTSYGPEYVYPQVNCAPSSC